MGKAALRTIAGAKKRSGVTAVAFGTSVFLLLWPFVFGISPLIAGGSERLIFVLITPPLVGVLFLSAFRRSATPSKKAVVFLILAASFALLTAIAALRAPDLMVEEFTARAGLAASVLLFFGVAIQAFLMERSRERLISALTLALPVYVAANLLLFIIFGPEMMTPLKTARFPQMNQFLAIFGISFMRVSNMGLMQGSNVIGLMAGLSIVFLGIRLGWDRPNRLWLIGVLVLNIAALLMVETRAAIAVSLLCLGLHYARIKRRTLLKAARWAVGFAAVSPIILAYMFWRLSNVSIASALIRQAGDGEALGFGTGRSFVWDTGIRYLWDFSTAHIFGYGHFGHIVSGASRPFEWIFGTDLGRVSFHNATLQNVYDIGYLGAALYLLLLWRCFTILSESRYIDSTTSKGLMTALLFITICGYTEVSGTMYHFEVLCVLMGVCGVAFAALMADAKQRPDRAVRSSTHPRGTPARYPGTNTAPTA